LYGREFAERAHLLAVENLVLEFAGSPFRERLAFVMSFDVGKAPFLLRFSYPESVGREARPASDAFPAASGHTVE
jgi:hypothetical protein